MDDKCPVDGRNGPLPGLELEFSRHREVSLEVANKLTITDKHKGLIPTD